MIYDWYFDDGFPGVILQLIMSEKRFFFSVVLVFCPECDVSAYLDLYDLSI